MDQQKVAGPYDSSDWTVLLDYQGGTVPIYVGKAQAGSSTGAAVWQIRQITYDANSNPLSVLWAGGAPTFVNVWTSRTGYTYS